MKCKWCGKEYIEEDMNEVCSEICREKLKDYSLYIKKNLWKFYTLFLIGIVGLIISEIIFSKLENYTYFISFAWFGIIEGINFIKFPFCTSISVDLLGLKKTIIIGRIIGVLLLIGGLVFLSLWIIEAVK